MKLNKKEIVAKVITKAWVAPFKLDDTNNPLTYGVLVATQFPKGTTFEGDHGKGVTTLAKAVQAGVHAHGDLLALATREWRTRAQAVKALRKACYTASVKCPHTEEEEATENEKKDKVAKKSAYERIVAILDGKGVCLTNDEKLQLIEKLQASMGAQK